MGEYRGGCHCGNVRYTFFSPRPPAQWAVRRCTCAYCVRYGARYTSGSDTRLEVTVLYASMVNRYEFGTRTARFLRCARCGVLVLASCATGGRRLAVLNVNTLDAVETLGLVAVDANFDEETLEERLRRRGANWIPELSLRFVNA